MWHGVAWIICSDDDFTDLRGTTRVVLRSRHWQTGRTPPEAEESVGAVMPRGSCVFYSGRTYHGSGENTSGATRNALNFAYALAFLKPEMNTWVGVPPAVAAELQPLIAELAGYGGASGYSNPLEKPGGKL
jgi:ectoine hydroxylase-related dioxygenase (phytanoyl-CoA dioxygenase family)